MPATRTTTRAAEVIARCVKLASFSEDPHSIRRTFLSPPMHDCHRELSNWLSPLGANIRIDAAGNFRALYPAAPSNSKSNSPRILIGSHLDTVPNAGAYDGVLGVTLAISLLEELKGRKLPFAIEVVGFSEEEGVRFGIPFIGSRALVGRLDHELLDAKDAQGITVCQVIEAFELNPQEIPHAQMHPDTLAFLEFHIEQGPVLDSLNQPLAAVESIAGQSRFEFTFVGRANHAGTTPMNLRRDALAAAAEWISAVEQTAQAIPGLVATVGKIDAIPGASNVIASEARMSLDVRHSSDRTRTEAAEAIVRRAKVIATRRGLSVHHIPRLTQPAVAMNSFLTTEIEKAIALTRCNPHRMVSGAGHDAMILAEKIPAAMIFLRSPGGISHDPSESVAVEDVELAIQCGLHLLDHLAASPEFLSRNFVAQDSRLPAPQKG